MFKTIQDCQLELVAHSIQADFGDFDGFPASQYEVYNLNNLDFMPCSAARVSFGNEDKTGNDAAADRKLMNYLAKHKHMSPFEHQSATFLIECPLFIRSQVQRHRTFSYNEISRRYTDENLEFWVPDTFRGQSKSNRQASDGPVEVAGGVENWQHYVGLALGYYGSLLDQGVCREQARAVLPQSLLTKFYMTGNLRNWAHFLELRLDEHSQYEVRFIAQRIEAQLKELWPNAMEALCGT